MVRMYRLTLLFASLAFVAPSLRGEDPSAAVLLERGIYQEQAVGDLVVAPPRRRDGRFRFAEVPLDATRERVQSS